MNKMRVLALTTSYPLHRGGSAGLFVQRLYQRLAAECAINVVCPADSRTTKAAFDDSIATDIRIHGVRYAPKAWRTLAQESGGVVSGLRRAPWRALLLPALLGALFWRCFVHARGTDLIHANWAVCGVIAGTVGRLRRKPVITTLRGDDVTRADRSRLDRVILASAVHNSRIITCVSEGMAERLRKRFPARAADIHACLNGVDDAFFQIGRTAAHGDALRLLAVGSLIRRKGFDVLIEAIARTRNREHVVVCIVGEGPELGSLQALAASRRVSSCFRFLGAVPGTDMPKRFSEADAFVLSSRSEGRPNVVVEALASGLPVISTDLEGVQGMVKNGDTGWLVPVDDSAALAAALDQAAADRSELRRRGERARVLARGTIGTWTDTARCYAALFRVVLGSGERQHSSCAG